jgi:hypothetical protein
MEMLLLLIEERRQLVTRDTEANEHTDPETDASRRSTRASPEGWAYRLERHSVGAADGCSVGRCPRPLSFLHIN